MLFDGNGNRMTPSHAGKKSTHYRYYLTRIGRAATAALCRVTQTVIIPALA